MVSSVAQSDLILSSNNFNPSPAVNAPFTYTYTVQNDGPSKATGVKFTDTLPMGATFLYGTTTQGTLSQSNGVVTTGLGSLADNASASITLTYSIATSGAVSNSSWDGRLRRPDRPEPGR